MTRPPSVSVVVCAHNPRAEPFRRALASLAGQSLPKEDWELVLVDNASDPPVEEDLTPTGVRARRVAEPELGLTRARLRGIAEARAEILVLADDDNVLAPDYLERALELMRAEPEVGAAGGVAEGEFGREPASWAPAFLNLLGVRDFGDRPMRALVHDRGGPWEPIGAGMVVRRRIALHYSEIARDAQRGNLDRIGDSLGSCGDTDLARCACDLGYQLAYEPTLRLRHLIPAERLTFSYLARLSRTLYRSGAILDRIRGHETSLTRAQMWLRAPLIPLRTVTGSLGRWAIRMAGEWGRLEGRVARLAPPGGEG